MAEDALAQELDERLLEGMPEKKLLIMAYQQQTRNYAILVKQIADYKLECDNRQKKADALGAQMAGLKGEWRWMKSIVAGGFLVAVLIFIRQAVWGK